MMSEAATKTETNPPYFYDADGLRVSRKDNISGVTTYYVWDDQNPTGYPQVVEEIEDGVAVRRYAYGPTGIISQQIYSGTSWDTHYYNKDGTGTIRSLTDEAGDIVFSREYDAWGNVLLTTNLEPGTLNCNFGLHGEYVDSAAMKAK